MKLEVINNSKDRMPRKFLENWVLIISKILIKSKVLSKQDLQKNLTIVFLKKNEAKNLNFKYRGKKYATDVLSFESLTPDSLGELVLCSEVLKKQSKEHGLTFQQELGYMILHGVLHLKGYDHEKSPVEAKKMFLIQDRAFEIALGLRR